MTRKVKRKRDATPSAIPWYGNGERMTMMKKRRDRGPVVHVDHLNPRLIAAMAAWGKVPSADCWGPVQIMMLATWKGIEIGWPQGGGHEAFWIFRIDDSVVIEEEELCTCDACKLDWTYFRVDPRVVYSER